LRPTEQVIDCPWGLRIIGSITGSTGRRLAFGHSFPVGAMTPFETIYIDEMVAACNGGGGPLGHPRVYLNLAPEGRVECPYCSRLYLNRAMSAAAPPTERPEAPTS